LLPDPRAWAFDLSTFLEHTPFLTQIWLSFVDSDWKDTEIIFYAVSTKVVLPNLVNLVFDGIRVFGSDLERFLKGHSHLQSLGLNNMDIKGPEVSFADILKELESFDKLKSFDCYQIAQDGFRIGFKTLCVVSFDATEWHDETGVVDFVWLDIRRYMAKAEEWEGVQRKLGNLRRDLIVTRFSHKSHSDSSYTWY
jgi:hypothetical protein